MKAVLSMRLPALLSILALAACAPADLSVSKGTLGADLVAPAGPMLSFPASSGLTPSRSNDQIAMDFLDLEFHMESGQSLPVLTRFDGPISIALTGNVPPTARADLQKLITRLRAEAGIDLLITSAPANLTVEFAPKAALRRFEPTAACYVVPNVSSLQEYRARRGTVAVDWTRLTHRTRAAIFIPSDTSPQEVRDCLHEEVAQAIGPLNDLYRLPDSVFNDDNFQSVLTGFDMLMLRLHYAPEFANGMSEAQVAAQLPALLARLNPAGEAGAGWTAPDTPRVWLDAVATALGPNVTGDERLNAAHQMLAMAQQQGWQDNRLGFAYYALGRQLAPHDPVAAQSAYTEAARVYAALPDGGVHLAQALMQLAALDLAYGQPDAAISTVDQALPKAQLSQNAALLATLMMIKAEGLTQLGRDAEAQALRLDSLPAARYGFGNDPQVRARAAEIASLGRRGPNG